MSTISLCPNFSIKKTNLIYTLLAIDIISGFADIINNIIISKKYNAKNLVIIDITLDSLLIILALTTLIKYLKEKKKNDLLKFYSFFRIVLYVVDFIFSTVFFFLLLLGDQIKGIEFMWDFRGTYCIFMVVSIVWCLINVIWSFNLNNTIDLDEKEKEEGQDKDEQLIEA